MKSRSVQVLLLFSALVNAVEHCRNHWVANGQDDPFKNTCPGQVELNKVCLLGTTCTSRDHCCKMRGANRQLMSSGTANPMRQREEFVNGLRRSARIQAIQERRRGGQQQQRPRNAVMDALDSFTRIAEPSNSVMQALEGAGQYAEPSNSVMQALEGAGQYGDQDLQSSSGNNNEDSVVIGSVDLPSSMNSDYEELRVSDESDNRVSLADNPSISSSAVLSPSRVQPRPIHPPLFGSSIFTLGISHPRIVQPQQPVHSQLNNLSALMGLQDNEAEPSNPVMQALEGAVQYAEPSNPVMQALEGAGQDSEQDDVDVPDDIVVAQPSNPVMQALAVANQNGHTAVVNALEEANRSNREGLRGGRFWVLHGSNVNIRASLHMVISNMANGSLDGIEFLWRQGQEPSEESDYDVDPIDEDAEKLRKLVAEAFEKKLTQGMFIELDWRSEKAENAMLIKKVGQDEFRKMWEFEEAVEWLNNIDNMNDDEARDLDFLCPVSFEFMKDPVEVNRKDKDGNPKFTSIYSRSSATEVIKRRLKDVVNQRKFKGKETLKISESKRRRMVDVWKQKRAVNTGLAGGVRPADSSRTEALLEEGPNEIELLNQGVDPEVGQRVQIMAGFLTDTIGTVFERDEASGPRFWTIRYIDANGKNYFLSLNADTDFKVLDSE